MYLPKNRIRTGLYSQGTLQIKRTGEIYYGYYWSTFDGLYFSGKDQNERSSEELVKPEEDVSVDKTAVKGSLRNSLYNSILNETPESKKLPLAFKPTLVKEDYIRGYIHRYFLKRISQEDYTIYIEVDREQYNAFKSNDNTYALHLYIPFTLKWQIKGESEEVQTKNEKEVKHLIQKDKNVGENFYFYFTNFTEFLF